LQFTSWAYQPKPDPAGYQRLLEQLGISGPQAVMIDDRADNLLPALRLSPQEIIWVSWKQQ
jgi:HAD superfamily hydrolase (TIGR01509 family)